MRTSPIRKVFGLGRARIDRCDTNPVVVLGDIAPTARIAGSVIDDIVSKREGEGCEIGTSARGRTAEGSERTGEVREACLTCGR